MKKIRTIFCSIFLLVAIVPASAQKNVAEATITYKTIINTGNNASQIDDASTTIYIKGKNTRTEMVSPFGSEITIYNSNTDNAVILKEFSGQKLMITLTKENLKAKNKMYSNIKFDLTDEYKTIEGYKTRKAVAKMTDGKTFEVYYTPDIIPANRGYDATFSNLPGLAVQYQIEAGKMIFKYTLSKINYDPVPVSKFDFPTAGYRVMTYDENQNLKKGK